MRKLLVFVILIIFYSCKATKVDFYLPENFEGEAAMIYIADGNTPIYKNDRQQVFVPDSAVIFINKKFNEGQTDLCYYIKNKNGYSKLEMYYPGMVIEKDKTYIFFERILSFYLDIKNEEPIIGHFFYVGKQLDTTVARQRFFFENKIENLLKSRKNS